MFVYALQDPYPFVDKVGEEEMELTAQHGFTLNSHFFVDQVWSIEGSHWYQSLR